jgi:WD40 repeat protein
MTNDYKELSMFRWFIILLLAVGIAGGAAWYFDLYGNVIANPSQPNGKPVIPRKVIDPVPLYTVEALKPLPPRPAKTPRTVVVDPCHLVARHKQEVSCQKDGQLLFIGQLVSEEKKFGQPPHSPETASIIQGENKLPRYYRPWEEGDIVEDGQMLALVDPSLALNEVISKEAKVKSAEADFDASVAILGEAKTRFERLERLSTQAKGAVSEEERGGALLTVWKYHYEKVAKAEAIKSAKIEKGQADTILQFHELRSLNKGKSVITKILRQKGWSIKQGEPVMQLHNLNYLRAEGTVDVEELAVLKQGLKCYIEPSIKTKPEHDLIKAHRGPINSVSVFNDGMHFASGSEDHTVCIWQRGRISPIAVLNHKAAVRVLACSPPGSPKNWLLVGCSDGSISVWNLAFGKDEVQLVEKANILPEVHRGGVTALAFSPKGTYFATGGEDNAIQLWQTATAKVVYALDAEHGAEDPHQGTVTSLHFTPQAKLVSAARDNTLRVWALYKEGVKLENEPITRRGGAVSLLGVSMDGRYMLFDQGKTLQVLHVADGKTACVLENLAGANTFETLALFSPDGTLMLTGGGDEGRVHLWKAPAPEERGFQMHELVTRDRAGITCGAFATLGNNFAVTGSKDGYVHVWKLPSEAEVKEHRILIDATGAGLQLDFVERSLDGSKTRISVNVENAQDRLTLGQRVTVVVVLDQ